MRLFVYAIIALVLASLSATLSIAAEKETISLTIDYGDAVQKKFAALEWKEGMTIADALDAAQKHPRGIKYTKRSSGSTAFLLSIDELKSGEMERYWLYEVNGKAGDQSYAITKLKAGDAVLWKFDFYK